MKQLLILSVCLFLFKNYTISQTYTIDARIKAPEILTGHLKMGDPGPKGKEILINNKYMTIGGKPVIPVMGEIHYARYPRDQWEDAILKMKANGINIIACYVFWIHHEEIEGQFEWTGNNDLRHFLELCKKNNLYAYPRIGPWCHGEVRNGGTPDWILSKTYLKDRSNDPAYQYYADRWYHEVSKQLKGLLYKDGGPVIGIQFDNEYRRGPGGEAHILWLKQTARKYGIDVPMYTVTGWGNASVPQDEVIPLWGGYPAEPWATHIRKIEENLNYVFEAPMNDENIGNEAVKRNRSYIQDYSRYPYFTCELGIGNQLSEHRRPVLSPFDGLAIATAKTGSGSNLPGYYVFTGGINPVGIHTTMEENQDETAYWNEYPDISYDFQAAIRETGELSPSYYQVKKLHYFLNEFGDRLASMTPVVINGQDSKVDLQYAARVKDNAGFVFAMNYYRGYQKPLQKDVKFEIILENENIIFPSKGVDIPDSSIMIWPFNFEMDGVLLKYSTAQPLCRIEKDSLPVWVFIQNKGIIPEMCFHSDNVMEISLEKGKVIKKQEKYTISQIKPGLDNPISIKNKNGFIIQVIVLSYEQSSKVWVFENNKKKELYFSNVNLYKDSDNRLHMYGYKPQMKLQTLNGPRQIILNNRLIVGSGNDLFKEYQILFPEKNISVEIQKKSILDDAQWLKSSVDEITGKNQLYHKIFMKEFNLGNPSKIKKATIFIYTDNYCKININRNWVNQQVDVGNLKRIDVTGYLSHGDNFIMLDFPVTIEESAFAARVIIEYYNSDRFEFVSDRSWQAIEQYRTPIPGKGIKNLAVPEIVASRQIQLALNITGFNEWSVRLPENVMNGLNNLYLHIDYNGDKGQCRIGKRLISDNFNNGTYWPIEIKHLGNTIYGNQMLIEITPLMPDYKIYFEKEPKNIGEAEIINISVLTEYKVVLEIN